MLPVFEVPKMDPFTFLRYMAKTAKTLLFSTTVSLISSKYPNELYWLKAVPKL